MPDLDALPRLAIALGLGLLIGLERERRKGAGPGRAAAGIRTFAVVALTGAIAQAIDQRGMVPAGAVLVILLVVVSHARSRSVDPGLTTEFALFTTYLVGVLCASSPALGAACGAAVALLLATRRMLHRFATELLSEQEMQDGLLLTALALIVMPLIPPEPVAALGGLRPRPLAAMVLLVLAVQAAAQMAERWLGTRRGAAASSLAAGFVSSTAAIASLARRARERPDADALLAGAATLTAVSTWLQALLICFALSPSSAWLLLACAAPALVLAALAAAVLWREPDRIDAAVPAPAAGSALRPGVALGIAATLAVVTVCVTAAQRSFGNEGLLWSVALAGLVDAHAPLALLAALHAESELPGPRFLMAAMAVLGSNTLMHCGVAWGVGGWRFGMRASAGLLLSYAGACIAALWAGR